VPGDLEVLKALRAFYLQHTLAHPCAPANSSGRAADSVATSAPLAGAPQRSSGLGENETLGSLKQLQQLLQRENASQEDEVREQRVEAEARRVRLEGMREMQVLREAEDRRREEEREMLSMGTQFSNLYTAVDTHERAERDRLEAVRENSLSSRTAFRGRDETFRGRDETKVDERRGEKDRNGGAEDARVGESGSEAAANVSHAVPQVTRPNLCALC